VHRSGGCDATGVGADKGGEREGSYLYANAIDFYTPEELQKRTFGIGS